MKPIIAIVLLLGSTLCAAADPVIVMPARQPYYSEDGNASYQRLMQEILRRSGDRINIDYYPPARSIQIFDQKMNACSPAARKLASGFLGYDVIDAGVAINEFRIVIATLKSQPPKSSVESLNNRSIATILGQALGVYGIPISKMTVHYVADIDQAVRLLEKGRVHAIVESAVNLLPYRNQLNFDVDRPVFSIPQSIICHPGPESRAFLKRVGPAIESMHKDGSLKSILGDYYLLD